MRDEFEIENPQGVQAYLATFPSSVRRKGEEYFRQGRVLALGCCTPGTEYEAQVKGTQIYIVELCYDVEDGWTGVCTCPMEYQCKHIYAAVKALLAENNTAVVRDISAGAQPKTAANESRKPATS